MSTTTDIVTATAMVHGRALAVALALVALTLAFVVASGAGAGAELERPIVAGQVTIGPGQTLWDVAVEHAPPGTDPRDYLSDLRALNGLTDATTPPWTVVLLPAVR